jgi:putative transposase
MISPHPIYRELGAHDIERSAVYRELFRYELEPGIIDQIRDATNGNFAWGSPRFQEEISRMLGRRVSPGRPGRPKKSKGESPM